MNGGVAIGFRCHSGWAVMVTVTGSVRAPRVLDRRRVELLDASLPRQPYHAVAEHGAARTIIADVEDAARKAASDLVRAVDDAVAVGVVAAERSLPDNLDDILRVHARLHSAEGWLYERAVIEASADAGLAVHVVAPTRINVTPTIESLRSTLGPPWQKDHKWATVAALSALVGGAPAL